MLHFTTELIRNRKAHPVFRRRRWFEGRSVRGSDHDDIVWYQPDGQRMSHDDWNRGYAKSFAVYLNGKGIPTLDARGRRVIDDSFIVLFNAHDEPVSFTMPDELADLEWEVMLYSAVGLSADLPTEAPESAAVDGWSVALLRKRNGVA
jgi:glycogen operon protein